MHKVMPEQDTEITGFEPTEGAASVAAEESNLDETARLGDDITVTLSEPAGREEYDQLKTERDQLLDRLARLQAEFENARKRAERDRVADREYATASVVEQFLPVLDNFDLALKSDSSAEQLRAGVELIVKQMQEILLKFQVTQIPAVGEAFDPRQHEALGTVERLDLPDQHVAEEIRRGYKLRDRLLRPALVRVASNPNQTGE
jgi:molecular chaperone GrpE